MSGLANLDRPYVHRMALSVKVADFVYFALQKVVNDARERNRQISKQGVVELALVKLLGLTPPKNHDYFR
jgi:hypothetical protein